VITNVSKKDGGWWMGDHGGIISGHFPSNYVEEIEMESLGKEDKDDGENPLGSLEKAVLDVKGLRVFERPSTAQQKCIFGIGTDIKTCLDVGVDSNDEIREWAKAITEAATYLETMAAENEKRQKRMRIHQKLSDLIYYSQSVSLAKDFKEGVYSHMSSLVEKQALFLAGPRKTAALWNRYSRRQLSRIYPNGKRVDSSNYDPQPLFNVGCQLVALNFQTADRPMWLNHGFFTQNGGCGMVLKPKFMRDPDYVFEPHDRKQYEKRVKHITVRIQILSARHLMKPTRGIASPFVEIEVTGVDSDSNRFKVKTCSDNGLCPTWNDEAAEFQLSMPELASIKFIVQDEDMFGDANTIGQNVYPLGNAEDWSLRSGYRLVQLNNGFNDYMELSSVLIKIDLPYIDPSSDSDYQPRQDLRDKHRELANQRDELIKQITHKEQSDQDTTEDKEKLKYLLTAISTTEAELKEHAFQKDKSASKKKKK
jgi:hypothetical protein